MKKYRKIEKQKNLKFTTEIAKNEKSLEDSKFSEKAPKLLDTKCNLW